MASWAELLIRAEPGKHVVQLYGEDDGLLARNVSRYLAEGLRRGDGLVVIATPEHTSAIARHLVEDEPRALGEAERTGRVRWLDARETLERLLTNGNPEEATFRSLLGATLTSVRGSSATGQVRAFGEMVSLLWEAGKRAEADRLEALWNDNLAKHDCSLYCAYRIDLFSRGELALDISPIVCSHDHLLAGAGTLLSSGRSRT